MKIYTRKGDNCETKLVGGVTVPKNHIRLDAYGTIDELIAHLALLHDFLEYDDIKLWLTNIQDKLMIAAALIASDGSTQVSLPSINQNDVLWLENTIDEMDKCLVSLNNFILPGGDVCVSQAHICRTICRRAERHIVSVHKKYRVEPILLLYFNRLSDFLFVLARFIAKRKNVEEKIWNPKKA
jgi:cob(I)alamin adenosyltransferase